MKNLKGILPVGKHTRRHKALKLRKQMNEISDSKTFKTSITKIKKWLKTLNESIFSNEVPAFDEIKLVNLRDCVGCVEYEKFKSGRTHFCLKMRPSYPSQKEFIDTLGHEMIHLWQMKVKGDTGNHNKLFYSFRPKFNYAGLKL